MHDQADNLRQLVRAAMPLLPPAPTGPPMIAVTGCAPGVGTTTVAMNLAAVLADGAQVLALDAAQQRPALAECAGVGPGDLKFWLADVLSGKCTAAEAKIAGPAGVSLLANRCGGKTIDSSRQAQQRLLSELNSLRDDVDLVVADIGSGLTPWTRRFWLRASLVLLVTTNDTQALLNAYATIKLSVADTLGPEVCLLMNGCDNERAAAEAQQRIAAASARFLSRSVQAMPALPSCDVYDGQSDDVRPRVWQRPHTPFGHAMLWLGRAVGDAFATLAPQPDAAKLAAVRSHDTQAA